VKFPDLITRKTFDHYAYPTRHYPVSNRYVRRLSYALPADPMQYLWRKMRTQMLAHLRSQGIIALVVASCGLTALLLEGGDAVELLSIDTARSTESEAQYPTEFLNTINVSGMPVHNLKLKVGAPVLLMRNLNIRAGLSNGHGLL
jgi:hypothetical protein